MTCTTPPMARAGLLVGRVIAACLLLALAGCVPGDRMPAPRPSGTATASATPRPTASPTVLPPPPAAPPSAPPGASGYPWHTDIVATTFWVGEIFDPGAPDGSQEISTYDSDWLGSYGGCDGVNSGGGCATEPRSAANSFFPSSMAPRENPFYLDLPYDDINDETGFAQRDAVIPWAAEFAGSQGDSSISYLKNRWVQLVYQGSTCYGQIEDAGPGEYHDAAYVFGSDDARPANTRYGGAGMDVSPALTGCLGLPDLDGVTSGIDWRFVDADEVPAGPWLTIVTTSPVR